MLKSFTLLLSLALLGALIFLLNSCASRRNVQQAESANPNFHIYLCFGQSNMEGSAPIEAQDTVPNQRFMVLQAVNCEDRGRQQGQWYTAVPPLSHCGVGLSPADAFGQYMVSQLPTDTRVGVMNIAIGGCDIRLFDKDIYQGYTATWPQDWFINKVNAYGGNPYQHLVKMAKQAQQVGIIKGILLHQGETNTGDEQWTLYVKKIYNDLLSDLGLSPDEVPLLVGETVHEEQGGVCARMNPIINRLPEVIPTAHVISSRGCEALTDSLHFSSAGVRELGRRYAKQILVLQD